jgi:octaprenyl-diphosphate synthase
MPLSQIITRIQPDWDICNKIIKTSLGSDVPLIEQINNHITQKPGKRLRPLISILTARVFGHKDNQHHLTLGAIIELIHTATLLHDDVIDESQLRRGQKTANNIWGNTASILTGDFLYSRSFQLMNEIGSLEVMSELADTSNQIAQGEMFQLSSIKNAEISIEHYFKVIKLKTAKLFEAAAKLSAIISKQDEEKTNNCANFGQYLGIAFQLVDDILDYSSTDSQMGKSQGDDLREGKPTLPILIAIDKGSKEQQDIIKSAINNADESKLEIITNILIDTNSLELAKNQAKDFIIKAKSELKCLPDNEDNESLSQICDLAINRIS